MLQSEDKLFAALCHIGALIGLPILLPVIIYIVKKDNEFVRHHAKEAIAFQLTTIFAIFVSALLIVILIGLLLVIVIPIFSFVMTIIAIIKAADGEYFRYPLSTHFAEKF